MGKTTLPLSIAIMSDAAPALLIVLITILFPPVGVAMVAGCGFDLFVNICLTILGYFPGHIHAFYLEYVYFDRRDRATRRAHRAAGAWRIQRSRTERRFAPAGLWNPIRARHNNVTTSEQLRTSRKLNLQERR